MTSERAVSTVVGYILAVSIMLVVLIGLISSAGTFVETQSESVAREQMEVIGEKVANHIVASDQVVSTTREYDPSTGAGVSSTLTLSSEVPIPERVAGQTYSITVKDASGPDEHKVVVESHNIEVTTTFTSNTDVGETTVSGSSTVVINFDTSSDTLVVENE